MTTTEPGLTPPGVDASALPETSALPEAVDPRLWSDWRWQMSHRLRDAVSLSRHLRLSVEERAAFNPSGDAALTSAPSALPPVAITPYYLSLMDPEDPRCPIRRQALPHPEDRSAGVEQSVDPLGERGRSPVQGLIHRYRDRVVILAAADCPVRCRHCNRRARDEGEFCLSRGARDQAIAWISDNAEVCEAILSGGDPLTLSDAALGAWLDALSAIPHVETLRVHSRALVTCPMRVTPALAALLRAHAPLTVVTQFNHPREVTPEAVEACGRLVDAGVPVANQSVLLRGINSDPEILLALSRALLRARVRPYYLFQLDPVVGAERFKTPVRAGVELVASLRGRLSGMGIPTLVLDAPGGHGKVALLPESILRSEPGRITVRTWTGAEVDYPDTGDPDLSCPVGRSPRAATTRRPHRWRPGHGRA